MKILNTCVYFVLASIFGSCHSINYTQEEKKVEENILGDYKCFSFIANNNKMDDLGQDIKLVLNSDSSYSSMGLMHAHSDINDNGYWKLKKDTLFLSEHALKYKYKNDTLFLITKSYGVQFKIDLIKTKIDSYE